MEDKYRPLSPWEYFELSLLFNIPIIGLVFLIINSIDGMGNINRRNYARSFWCIYVVILIIFVVLLLLGVTLTLPSIKASSSNLPTAIIMQ